MSTMPTAREWLAAHPDYQARFESFTDEQQAYVLSIINVTVAMTDWSPEQWEAVLRFATEINLIAGRPSKGKPS